MHETNATYLPGLGPLFRALPGLYLVIDPEFMILDATDAFLQAASVSRNQIVGQLIFEAFPNNPAAPNQSPARQLEKSLRHVLRHKAAHTMPVLRYYNPKSIQTPDTALEERYWNSTNTPVLDEKGNISYILYEARDMTDQIQREQSALYSQQRLSMLTSATHAVAWEYDIVQDRLHWGSGLKEILGYSPEDIGKQGLSWDSRVHPDDYPAIQQSIAAATSSGEKTWAGEYRFLKANGTYAHVLDQGYIIYDEGGRAIRSVGSIIDLSRNKQAEQELQESNTRFRHLLEVLPHMAWTSDAQGRLMFFNDNWYSYTGMRKGQTDGWISVVHPEDSALVLTVWHEAIVTGQQYELEYRIRSAMDNSYRWFLERAVPMHDDNGKLKLWVGTFTDIEEQKQAVEQLQQKDQQLQNILRLSPAHLCLLKGPTHICRYVTPGVYEVYGNRQYLGRKASEIWPELRHLGFTDLLDQVYHKADTVQITEFRAEIDRYRNGKLQEAYFNFKYQPLLEDGEVDGILISAVEVTELVEAKRKAEALARALGHQ